jgi:hypothetical protein
MADCADCGLGIYEMLGHRAMVVDERFHWSSDGESVNSVEDVYAHHFCPRGRRSKKEKNWRSRADDRFKQLLFAMAALAGIGIIVGYLTNREWLVVLGGAALVWLAIVYIDS